MSRIQLEISTLDAARQRFKYLFDHFDIVVSISGGKDSSVILKLAIDEARKQGKLPVKAIFIDQEGELQSAIDIIKISQNDPDVDLYWYQIPLKINISTNSTEQHFYCWEDGKESEWIRPKEITSIHHADYVTPETYFNQVFDKILKHDFPNYANIGGVRTQESPKRLLGLTQGNVYKGITWGKNIGFAKIFYPIYDWNIHDVWHFIYENKIPYCTIYDYQHQIGIPLQGMRVSSIFHENSLGVMSYLPKAEPETWNKVVKRIKGANTLNKGGFELYNCPDELPPMFTNWNDYITHLLVTLISDDYRESFIKKINYFKTKFDSIDKEFDISEDEKIEIISSLNRVIVTTILRNDFVFTLLKNHKITAWQKLHRRKLQKKQ